MVVLGDDDGKEDDVQSMASVGEEYEPISDDELDEILADSQKKEDQQEEEKITGTIKTFCDIYTHESVSSVSLLSLFLYFYLIVLNSDTPEVHQLYN